MIRTALAVCMLAGSTAMADHAWLLTSTTGFPWGADNYEQAMDTNFGAGNWNLGQFENVDPNDLFADTTQFIYLEGSDSSANELHEFLGENGAALEAWVSGGGTLLMNSAPNEGGGQNFGFGGVVLTYPDFSGTADAVDPNHPIFNGPFGVVATSYTGNSYSHGSVSGGDISAILVGENGQTILAEMTFGSGGVLFGGYTAPQFHQPQPDGQILLENIIAYTTTIPAPGAAALLGLGGLAAMRRRR